LRFEAIQGKGGQTLRHFWAENSLSVGFLANETFILEVFHDY
jgi:hypothetical protein